MARTIRCIELSAGQVRLGGSLNGNRWATFDTGRADHIGIVTTEEAAGVLVSRDGVPLTFVPYASIRAIYFDETKGVKK